MSRSSPGYLTRRWGEARRGREWYEEQFLPRIGPVALCGLLFTVVVLFALQGDKITTSPFDVARIALPLLAYFAIMWTGAFVVVDAAPVRLSAIGDVAFTAAGNNFELAIAVAIGVFGVTSGQALAGVVGPLIEVPVLVGLVYVALWARHRFAPLGGIDMNCYDCAINGHRHVRGRRLRRLRRRPVRRPCRRVSASPDPCRAARPARERRAARSIDLLRDVRRRTRRCRQAVRRTIRGLPEHCAD